MAFDFYFAGTQCEEANLLLKELNANVLKSYVNDKKEILKWFEYKRQGWKGKLLIDNGEFTFHRKGGSLDIDEYIKWLNDNDELIDYAIALDSIPGKWGQPRTSEDVRISAEKTWENFLYMRSKMKSPDKALPVFHMGESFDNFERFLQFPDLKYMCISGMKDLTNKQREAWYEKCFYLVSKYKRQDMKFHCLGSATIQNAVKFPFTSMDATSWIMTGSNGSVLTDWGVVYVGDECKTLKHTLPKENVELLEQYCNKFNTTLEDIGKDYKARMCFNVNYLYYKSQEVSYNGVGFNKRRLF